MRGGAPKSMRSMAAPRLMASAMAQQPATPMPQSGVWEREGAAVTARRGDAPLKNRLFNGREVMSSLTAMATSSLTCFSPVQKGGA